MSDASESGYAELNIDGLYLLLPRPQVARILDHPQIQARTDNGAWCGWLSLGRVDWPVLSLDGYLEPCPAKSGKRPLCALLRTERHGFGLLVDAVSSRDAAEARPLNTPPLLAGSTLMIDALARIDDYIVAIGDARHLLGRYTRINGDAMELLA